jgi:hypothetical protein
MAITKEDIVALASAFHDASMVKKSTTAELAEFFLYPESRIFVLHGGAAEVLSASGSDPVPAARRRHDVAAELRTAPEAHR